MSLEASTLTVQVVSVGITDATKALNDLAKAGEAAEQKTYKIGSGAQASAKAQVDAAQQAASAYNAIIDMMTEKSNTFYQDKAMKAAVASQQELFDGMSMMDKLWAYSQEMAQKEADKRSKESADVRAQQQAILDAATTRYAAEQELANRMNATYDKRQSASIEDAHAAAIIEDKKRAWQALGQVQSEAIKINRDLDAAQKRLEDDHASAILEDKRRAWKALGQAQQEALSINTKMDRDAQEARAEGDAYVAMLKRQAETVGMTTKQLKEYTAAQQLARAETLGVRNQVEGFVSTLQQAKGPHENFNLLTAGSAREMMVLMHELSQGQLNRFYGSLIVLGERINFLPKTLEKVAEAAASLGVSMSTLVVGAVAAAVAIGAAIYTYEKSRVALKELNEQAILTGHSFGATGEAMYEMSNKIGNANGRMADTRETMVKLAATGKFTADEIGMITEAAVGLEKYGGVSIDNTIKQFERLAAEPTKANVRGFKGISQAAVELNQQLGFLEPAVLAEVIHLERIGDVAGASAKIIKALADEEKNRIVELKGELTTFGQVLDDITTKAKGMWNSLWNKGTLQDQLSEVTEHIVTLSNKIGNGGMLANNGVLQNELNGYLAKSNEIQDKIAAKDKKEADAKHKRDLDNAADLAQVEVRNILERGKYETKFQEDKARLDKAFEDMHARGITTGLGSQEAYDQALAVLKKADTPKEAKPKSDGLAGLNEHLAEVNARYEIDKRYYDNQVKFINDLQQKKLISDSAADHAKKEFLDNESKMEADSLDAQMKLVDGFYSKDTRLMEQAATKRAEIQKRIDKNQADTAARNNMYATDPAAREQKEQDDADAATVQFVKQVNSQTQAIQSKIDAYNALPEAARAAITNEKQMQDEFTKAEIEWKQQQIDAITAMGEGSAEEVIRLNAEKKALEDRAKAQKAWEEIQSKINANAGRDAALNKVATEQVKMWKDIGNEIEKSLKTAFGNSGEAAGKMFKAFAEGQADQISLMNQARTISENKSLSEAEKEKQLNDIRLQGAQNQVGMYGNMADAASGFFEKGSTGYQTMAKAAMVLHTAEVTLSVIKGVNAILTQGSGGDVYSAFARMAAMAAIVAGLGVAISGSFGGGGSAMSSENQQKIQGTGSVLGSPTVTDGFDVKLVGAKSDSIANSLKIAEKNSGLGLVVQNDMLMALQKLNDNITNFATHLVQSTNIANPDVGNLNSNNGLATAMFSLIGGGIVGYVLAKIPVIGNLVGKIATSVMGGKQTLDDSGVTIGKTSLGDVMDNGINAQTYANITTSGGWFKSDSHDTKLGSLGSDANDQITKIILSMEDTLKTAAVGLGMGGDAFNEKLKSFVIDIGNISFKGMAGDEIQKTLQNVFSKLGDQMAQFAFADLQKYQKIGEGLMETVVRVANDLQQVNDVFTSLSKTIPAGMDAIEASEALISQFGSVDNLTKGVKSYINAIYTDQEKLMPIIKSVSTAMDGLGLSYVKTKEQFKAVVDSLDLTTEAGAKMFATLMNIAPAFAQTIDDSEKLANDARSALTDAYKRESQAITDTQTKMKNLVTTLQQLGSSSLLGDLSPLTPQQKYLEAKSQFDTIAAKAQGGDETAQGQFEGAYTAFLEASKVANASGAQYQKDFEYAQKVTQQATEWAQKQVNVQQATLDALNKQVEGLIDVNGGLLTVSQAIQNLITAMKGTPAGAAAQQQASTNAQSAIEGLYQSILHRASDTAGMQFWMDKVNQGVSIADIAKAIANSDEAMGNIKPISTGTTSTSAVAPVTAMVGTQSVAHADVVTAVKEMQAAVTNAITETGQTTTSQLATAVYDSQDKAADKTVAGVSDAVVSTKVGTSYQIKQR